MSETTESGKADRDYGRVKSECPKCHHLGPHGITDMIQAFLCCGPGAGIKHQRTITCIECGHMWGQRLEYPAMPNVREALMNKITGPQWVNLTDKESM